MDLEHIKNRLLIAERRYIIDRTIRPTALVLSNALYTMVPPISTMFIETLPKCSFFNELQIPSNRQRGTPLGIQHFFWFAQNISEDNPIAKVSALNTGAVHNLDDNPIALLDTEFRLGQAVSFKDQQWYVSSYRESYCVVSYSLRSIDHDNFITDIYEDELLEANYPTNSQNIAAILK